MMKKTKITIVTLIVVGIFFFLNAPTDFPVGSIIKIEQGRSLRSVSLQLSRAHLIRSRLVFEAFMILFNKEKVISTDYYFESKLPVYEIARRIARGESHIVPITLTIPEGFTNEQIADVASAELPAFNKIKFLSEVQSLQGYLFPDTYFFLAEDTETDVIHSMSQNFKKKVDPLLLNLNGKTENEIIAMASILEKEAKGESDSATISGILWNRIRLGIPLQVDAALSTYKTKGLPASPISNPGLADISAALHPQSSLYLYYLHDKDGNIHYAKTFAEHEANIKKYLQ